MICHIFTRVIVVVFIFRSRIFCGAQAITLPDRRAVSNARCGHPHGGGDKPQADKSG